MAKTKPIVGVVMGSDSDLETMKRCLKQLDEFEITYEVRIISAHRTPDQTASFVRQASSGGVKVFICGAGGAAHLAGAVAAQTTRPVIGVPIASSALNGLDALLATVQMPARTTVRTKAITTMRTTVRPTARTMALTMAPTTARTMVRATTIVSVVGPAGSASHVRR